MKKIISLFFVCYSIIFSSLLFFSCETTKIQSKSIEQAEVQEIDGTYIINNRDSNGNAFLNGKIIIKNKTTFYNMYKDVKILCIGFTDNGTKNVLFEAKSYNHKDSFGYVMYNNAIEYKNGNSFQSEEPEYNLSDYRQIIFVTTNGKITNSKSEIKNGNFNITIYDYDFSQLSTFVKNILEKEEEKHAEEVKTGEEKYNEFCKTVFENGKRLYEEKISSIPALPIFINSFNTENDVLDAVNAYITFENTSNKTIKYVDFELIPYNRVDDITYSTLDGDSTKTVQVVDYIKPNSRYKAKWNAVWYNSSIAYMKINSIRITYTDNSVEKITNEKLNGLFKKRELTKEVYLDSKKSLILKYNVADNDFYAELNLNKSMFMSELSSYQVYFETDLFYKDGAKINFYEQNATGSYETGALRFELDSDYNNFQTIYSAKSGEIRKESIGMLPGSEIQLELIYKFNDEQINFIKECICMKYYRDSIK